MTDPIPDLTPDQLPRMAVPVSWRPQVLIGEIEGKPSILLVIESANGTMVYTMPREFAENALMPMLNQGIVRTGGKSMLAGKIVPATLDDLRNMNGGPR